MTALPIVPPRSAGLAPDRLEWACSLLQRWVDADRIPAAALCVGRRGRMIAPRLFGRRRPEPDAPPLGRDALFLVASITKPVTVTAAMMLLERGALSLHDPVAKFVPPFAAHGKESVTILHLMTHTSGLPDMLPQNQQLRQMHRPFSAFVEEICKLPLLFPPGTAVNYQSMGTAMLAQVVQVVTGQPIAEFLRREVFVPLGMKDTSLGWEPEKRHRIAVIRVAPEHRDADWHWNSPYWLGFGAPWGGLITSPADLARFCQMMLNGGELGGVRILSAAGVQAMTCNQLASLPEVPEVERRCRPWGLGWRLNWPGDPSSFGDLLGPGTYGHWGATGTLCWLDLERDTFFLLLTTQPLDTQGKALARVSNAVAAALL